MASSFSWSDTAQIAFGSCLPCVRPTSGNDSSEEQNYNPAINRIPRARPDELQGLLADPDTDTEAERMSLHSNPGRGPRNRNKKKRRSKKMSDKPHRITLFGYDLFGRPPPPPIHLPDDSEDALYPRHSRESLTPSAVATTRSTSTFDSDAAPLDADTIAAFSSSTTPSGVAADIEAAAQASAEAEEQRLREKEARRQRRKEKKELKKLAEVLAKQGVIGDDGDDFEGFQGSGGQVSPTHSGYPRMPNAIFAGSDSGSGSGFSGSGREGFGRFVEAPAPHPAPVPGPHIPSQEDDEDEADLDGGLYARRAPRGASNGGGSDSRSRTSASASDRAHQMPNPRNAISHIQSQSQSQSRLNSPSQPHFQPSSESQPGELVAKKKKISKAKSKSSSSTSRTSKSHSSTTTSQSPSLPSPVSPGFPAGVQEIVSPSTIEQGQGFFDLEDEVPMRKPSTPTATGDFPSTRIGGAGAGGFPMTGFGGGGGVAKRTKDFGAFLARRGDDGEVIDGL